MTGDPPKHRDCHRNNRCLMRFRGVTGARHRGPVKTAVAPVLSNVYVCSAHNRKYFGVVKQYSLFWTIQVVDDD